MSKILIKNAMFYGFHGVHEFERELGQRFYFDIEMVYDAARAAETDSLDHALDYVNVYQRVKDIAENKRFMLLEALSGNICGELLAAHKCIDEITVRVRKPLVPMKGSLDYVQVETTRSRT